MDVCRQVMLGYSMVRGLLPTSVQNYGDRAVVGLLLGDLLFKQSLSSAQQTTDRAIDNATFAVYGGSTYGNYLAAGKSAELKFVTNAVYGAISVADSSPLDLADALSNQHVEAIQAFKTATNSKLPAEQRVLAGSKVLETASQDLLLLAGTADAVGFKGPALGGASKTVVEKSGSVGRTRTQQSYYEAAATAGDNGELASTFESVTTTDPGKTLVLPREKAANMGSYQRMAEEGKLVRTDPKTVRTSGFRKALIKERGPPPGPGYDADHVVELCLNGANCPKTNAQWLESAPNQSAGRKIGAQVKNDPPGTRYTNVKLEEQ